VSLLADLLLKIKPRAGRAQSKTDIPPGLKNVVSDSAKKESSRKRIAILLVVLLLAVGVGFGSIYVIERYMLPAPVKKGDRARRPAPAQPQQESPPVQGMPETAKAAPDTNSAEERKSGRAEEESRPVKQPKKAKVKPSKESIDKAADKETLHEARQAKASEAVERQDGQEPAKTPEKIPQPPIQTAAQQPPPKPDFASRDAYLYGAKSYESRKDYQQALLNYKKALELDPKNHIIMNNIAGVLINMGLYDEAVQRLKNAAEIKRDYVPSLINLAIAYIKLNDMAEGERHLSRALSIEPLNRSALLNLAVLHERQENNDKAYGYFMKLSEAGDIQGFVGIARIAEKQGRTQEAARIYREMLTISGIDHNIKRLANDRLFQLEQQLKK
jgi:tetratricopeptide (TPR) repeat protein